MARDTVCPAACGCAANLFHYPHSRVPLQLQSDRDSRADEGIAPSHDIRDISVTKLTLPERLANGRHVDPQAGLFNGCARPRSMHEFFAGYDLARTLREIDQDIERSAPEGKHHSVASKHSFPVRKLKRTEPQLPIGTVVERGARTHLGRRQNMSSLFNIPHAQPQSLSALLTHFLPC